MARMRERVFAGFGALLFLGSACALTIFVILQPKSATPATSQQQTCADNQTEATLPTPDIYKPEGAATSLQSTDLIAGTGAAAKSGDCLVMKYYGTLASDGSMFDEDFSSTQGFAFTLGQGQVIPGWDQGLVGLKVGGTRRLVIPASLGYGAAGSPPKIPANADLVFVVKLLRIQN